MGWTRAFQNVQGKEYKDVRPDAGAFDCGVDTKGLKGGENDEDRCPTVVEREGQVDKDLVRSALDLVILFDDIIYVLRAQYSSDDMRWRNRWYD